MPWRQNTAEIEVEILYYYDIIIIYNKKCISTYHSTAVRSTLQWDVSFLKKQ